MILMGNCIGISLCQNWEIFHAFLPSAVFFFKINFIEKSFRNAIKESDSLDPDQARPQVGPDLGPNCLQSYQQTTLLGKNLKIFKWYRFSLRAPNHLPSDILNKSITFLTDIKHIPI